MADIDLAKYGITGAAEIIPNPQSPIPILALKYLIEILQKVGKVCKIYKQ